MKTTLKEIKGKMNDRKVVWYLPTGYGSIRVRSISNEYVVTTGQDLTQRSYHCTAETVVYDSPEEADKQYEAEMELLRAVK